MPGRFVHTTRQPSLILICEFMNDGGLKDVFHSRITIPVSVGATPFSDLYSAALTMVVVWVRVVASLPEYEVTVRRF